MVSYIIVPLDSLIFLAVIEAIYATRTLSRIAICLTTSTKCYASLLLPPSLILVCAWIDCAFKYSFK